jgi:hypothetical protein
MKSPDHRIALIAIKVGHTLVWALFAGCIVAMPIASALGNHRCAAWFAAAVCFEIAVLLVNRMGCPLTGVAARYTDDRRANFDIYLPEWLARYNKQVFGTLFAAGAVYSLVQWIRS